MSFERALVAAGAGALMLIWLFLATRGVRQTAPTGGVVLRYRAFLRIFAWVAALGIPALALVLMVRAPVREGADPWWAGALMLLAGVVGGLLLLETERTEIVLDETGLRGVNAWRGERSIAWGQVADVSFSGLNRWFVVRGLRGETIRVSAFMGDMHVFRETIRKHVPQDRYAKALRGFA
jgi:hypothetical protein